MPGAGFQHKIWDAWNGRGRAAGGDVARDGHGFNQKHRRDDGSVQVFGLLHEGLETVQIKNRRGGHEFGPGRQFQFAILERGNCAAGGEIGPAVKFQAGYVRAALERLEGGRKTGACQESVKLLNKPPFAGVNALHPCRVPIPAVWGAIEDLCLTMNRMHTGNGGKHDQ